MARPRKPERTFDSHEKLFVGNLPCNTSDGELYALFATFGDILEIHNLGSNGSKSGQACAFVRYYEPTAARNAVNQLNGKVALRPFENPSLLLQVRPARAQAQSESSQTYMSHYGETHTSMWEHSSPSSLVKLFVGNLPRDVTADELNRFMLSSGIVLIEHETVILNGRNAHNQAACAFVFVMSQDDANRAISILDGKIQIRPNAGPLRISIAHDKGNSNSSPDKRPRAYSDSVLMHPSAYGTGGYLLPSPIQLDWAGPSFKTYHHYMYLPQSPHYGPIHIAPGKEPWRTGAIYPLPHAPFTMPYQGQ
jgi:RNA recognition motif-containing protein